LDNSNTTERGPVNPGETGPEGGARAWLARNGLLIALGVVLFVWLYNKMGADGLIYIAEAGIGLGFLIFIHELGHFLVAKWCDVHVETFSIGFGPAIPGCSFQRGETYYKIAWFPLGGYVKMVGEGPEDDEGEDDPRSFKNKPVWQRMAIISAGVFMNTITALVLFIFIYMTRGAEMTAGTIGMVDSGSPAWQAGVRTGGPIVRINDIRNPYFDDVQQEIMTTQKGETLSLVYEQPGPSSKEVQVQLEPRRDKDDFRPVVGIASQSDLKLLMKSARFGPTPVQQQSAAAEASPTFAFGDKILGMTDPDQPDSIKPIAENDTGEFYRRLCLLKGQPITIRVERRQEPRDPKSPAETLDVRVPVNGMYTLGIRMRMGHVAAVRQDSPALQAGVQPRNLANGIEGDIIKEVEVPEADGTRTRYVTSRDNVPAAGVTFKDLDPERLPFELEQWAKRRKGDAEVTLVVLRPVEHAARGAVTLKVRWDDSWRCNREVPYSVNSPLSIPELGLAYRVDQVVDGVEPSSPAQLAGVRDGDVIRAIRFQNPGKEPGERKPGEWVKIDDEQWAHAFWTLQYADFKEMDLRIENAAGTTEVSLQAQPDRTWPQAERGLGLMPAIRYQKADTPGQAIMLGLHMTTNNIRRIYQQVRALATNRVSLNQTYGPIEIGIAAYRTAAESTFAFLQLLALISINLAVINSLPLPVLDGGHMVFLGYELIRGKPASERVRVVATYAGLIMILSLMVLVIVRGVVRIL
jgi:regulator of sigma E protease